MHLRKNINMMFIGLLFVITLVSSIGGGIRYRENFLNEVFGDHTDDNLMVTNPFEPNIEKAIPHAVKPLFEDTVKPIQEVTTEEVVEEEIVTSIIKSKPSSTKPTSIKSNVFSQISGFDGDMYASF
tara:strand:- start:791 stop:1168 length:378 start_codon:yes stop_codon:yes gene_type:complete